MDYRKGLFVAYILLTGLAQTVCGQAVDLEPGKYAVGQFGGYGEGYFERADPTYEMPTVKFTLDGYVFSRVGGDTEQPLILEDQFPAPPSLTAGDLGFEGLLGGRAELIFYASPGRFAPRASVLWTGTEKSQAERTGNPADVLFFNAVAADPATGYTARNQSRFTLADIGLRRTISPTYGWSAGIAFGELIESLDLLAAPDPAGQQAGGTAPVESGFFSQTHNKFFGFQMGLDGQLWSNGWAKLDGSINAGVFHNQIFVGAQAENAEQEWEPDATSFISTFQLTLVLPADPVNFRFGYQGAYLGNMALPVSQSRERSIVQGTGIDATDDIWYHGFLFGIEWTR